MGIIKCLLGLHKYSVLNTEDIVQIGTNTVIGKVIVTQCENCGKIHKTEIKTVANIYIG